MATISTPYPNITWPQFAVCNDDASTAFEDMTRRLFYFEYLKEKCVPHSDHANPGVEVLPVLEPPHTDGSPQRRISFQSKYFEQGSVDYAQIQSSVKQAIKHYKGKLDAIYLFCNKTLTTTSSGYKTAKKILSDAGIELHPVSNREVLDLVAKYSEIANYFFRPREVADSSQANFQCIGAGIKIDKVSGAVTIQPDFFQPASIDTQLLRTLVSEKIRLCETYVCGLEIEALNAELDKLLLYDIDNIDGAETLYYYRLLSKLSSGEDVTNYLEKIVGNYHSEAVWLIEFYKNPIELCTTEFSKHTSEIQILIIEKLFSSQHWNCIVHLHEVADGIDPRIQTQFELHYGLSLFNLHDYDSARKVLQNLYKKTAIPHIHLYSIFAGIRAISKNYSPKNDVGQDDLIDLLRQLNEFKDTKQYQQNELLVDALKIESAYYLGLSNKQYLEDAVKEYEKFPESIKRNPVIKYYYALCLELNGNSDTAISVYASLEWNTDEAIATRYMLALILNGNPDTALTVYNNLNLDTTSPRIEGIYLLALYSSGNSSYKNTLIEAVKVYRKNLSALFSIAYYVENQTICKEIVIPPMKELISSDALNSLSLNQKIGLVAFFAHCSEINLLEAVIETIPDLAKINHFAVSEVYTSLFHISNCEYTARNKNFQKSDALEATERIADRFLDSGIYKKEFLQIKILCSGAKKLPFSMLKYSKVLFSITQDDATAQNIITLLLERNETNPNAYAPYLESLEKSESPDCCMAIASAMLRLGREETAEFYAYKALYILNGRDDYNIFKNYFSFGSYNMRSYHSESPIRLVKGNMVVVLEENGTTESPAKMTLCLDSEVEFSDESNRSLDIEHLVPSSPEYIKLQGSGLHQVLKLRGKKYQIIQIIPRGQYCLGYIFHKIQEHPDMFEGTARAISSADINEMIDQIKSLTDRSVQIEALFRSYHFEENELGLPIDSIAFSDYSRYIDTLKFLLYAPDQAFYAGFPVYEDETGQCYVPALSTLVLLSIMGKLDILYTIRADIIIPESYQAFFRTQYSYAISTAQVSAGTLSIADGKISMQDPDKTIPDIWESIIEFCKGCKTISITDEERINFRLSNELTAERLISGFNLDFIHLDSLILATKEAATYLCDDLFFRKLASFANIRNLNFVSLLEHYTDKDYIFSVIVELSKTNYLYVPPLARNDEEAKEIYQNLLTGEKKKQYYSKMLSTYFEVRQRIIEELLGPE